MYCSSWYGHILSLLIEVVSFLVLGMTFRILYYETLGQVQSFFRRMSPITATTRCVCVCVCVQTPAENYWHLCQKQADSPSLLEDERNATSAPPLPCCLLFSYNVTPTSFPPGKVSSGPTATGGRMCTAGSHCFVAGANGSSSTHWAPTHKGGWLQGAEYQLVPPHTPSLSHLCQMTREAHFRAGPQWQYLGREVKG